MVCHTVDEDAELFQRPIMRLADAHGRAFRSVCARKPAHHGADVPDMFRGDPGRARDELKCRG
jgi:para-nitrobenzyl esterase